MKRIILIFFSIILFNSIMGQTLLQKADTMFAKKDYYHAIDFYNKALKKATGEETKYIYFKVGECHRFGNKFVEAKSWFEKAINAGYDQPIINLYMGEMLLKNGDYALAKTQIENYLKFNPDNSIAKIRLESCNLGLKWQSEKPLHEIKNEKSLNSSSSDYGACYFKDNYNKVIFASTRMAPGAKYDPYTAQGFSDMYESTYDDVKVEWSTPVRLQGGINTSFNEGTFTYNPVANYGYYMQCNGENGKKQNCNIMYSYYDAATNVWGNAKLFEYNSQTFSVGHPTITADGAIMYIVSDMPGGYGGKDIYIIKKNGDTWSQPENIGPIINTVGDEMFPYISGDSLLIFASDGHPGFGGLDLYTSSIKNGKFSKPVNLLPPFNSSADDFNIILKKSKNEGHFSSNRPGGIGDDDIYSFRLIPVILSAIGNVKDKATNKNIDGVTIVFKGSDGSIDSVFTDPKGNYEYDKLKPNTKYTIRISKDGYLSDSKILSIGNEKYSKQFKKSLGLDLDFSIIKITKKEIKIDNIYYDYDKWDLRPESKIELNKLINVLKENANVNVQISAHTDERGAVDYNNELSQKRAQSVVDYLIEGGINPDRLIAKGYGFSMPIAKNAKTEEQHQKNRRTTFKILDEKIVRSSSYVQPVKSVPQTNNNVTTDIKSNQTTSSNVNTNTTTTTTTSNIKPTVTTNTTPANTNNISTTNNTSVSSSGKKFYIIASSHSSEQQAKDAVTLLKSKGFPDAEVVGKNDAGKWRICYKGYPTKEEASADLQKIKQNTNPSAWIFEKK